MGVKDVITGRLLSSANTKFSEAQIADMLQLLIGHGVKRNANTIHIEPHNEYVLIRYRIGGTLKGVHKLPSSASGLLIAKLKSLADLEPEEFSTPQEGNYIADVDGRPIHVRLSIMPVLGGEKAVLHLTPEHASLAELENLGFWGISLNTLHEALARPQGLLLVAGPKNSGKTTTIYSMLDLLNNPSHSIATIEERHTHHMNGVNQSYVHPRTGATVLSSLQAVLQQDPNIIMVSSLPDKASTELAVHSAVSGHFVLAEMYTDGAIMSALHVRSLTSTPFLFATALRAAVGQRLVRKLCQYCREHVELDAARRDKVEEAFGITTTAARNRVAELERAAKQAKLGGADDKTHASQTGISHVWRAHTGGCEKCDRTGYNGQIALVEVLNNNEAIQKRLIGQGPLTAGELHRAALKEGFVPMGLDGLVKALRGLTSIAEVLKAVGRFSD